MSNSILVLKFGGTSVRNLQAMRSAVDITLAKNDQSILVVSSAISGMTNTLVKLTDELEAGIYNQDNSITDIISTHRSISAGLINQKEVDEKLNVHYDFLKNSINLIKEKGNISTADRAAIISLGELFSTILLCAVFQEKTKNVTWFDIRNVMKTDANHSEAEPNYALINQLSQKELLPKLNNKAIIVSQGFIGSDPSGHTTLLGRGGSDYSASILGAALDAKQVEIWTDVNGMMSTDPRIVPNAQTIYKITYEEASELAYFGAKVLHPLTLYPVREKDIPVLIRNTNEPKHPGTTIVSKLNSDDHIGAKAIAFKKNITIINIISSRMLMAYGFLHKVFKIFDDFKTSVDIVSTSEVSISITIDDTKYIKEICAELSKIGRIEIAKDRAIISIVGSALRKSPGTAAKVFSAIPDININMISQGANQTNLSFIIDANHMEKAVQAIHEAIFIGQLKKVEK